MKKIYYFRKLYNILDTTNTVFNEDKREMIYKLFDKDMKINQIVNIRGQEVM